MNSGRKKISVILPTYNQGNFITEALESIRNQTYKDFELIVVDDGSTDDSPSILKGYQNLFPFKLITQPNQGLPKALNAGFRCANGVYLTWTSSDNILMPEMLEILSLSLDENPKIGVVYADWFFIDKVGNTISEHKTIDYDPYLILHHNYVHCCFMFRKECVRQVGLYDPEFIYGEDWEFWIRVSRKYPMKHIPQTLYKYRLHGNSMTAEILKGSAPKMEYVEFQARIRNRYTFAWYWGKIKFKLKYILARQDPRHLWSRAIQQSIK